MSYLEISYLAPVSRYNFKQPNTIYKLICISKTKQGYCNIIWDYNNKTNR